MEPAPDPRSHPRWASLVTGRHARFFAILLLAALAALLAAPELPGIERLRLAWFDTYQRMSPRVRDKAPAIIVEIDEKSLTRHGQWPWPRALLARLIDRIGAGGPAAIGLDLTFPEPDRLSAGILADALPGLDAATVARLKALPANDGIFADALRRTPTVLGVMGFEGAHFPTGARSDVGFAPARQRGGDAMPFVRGFDLALANQPELDRAATGRALLSSDLESGKLRRMPLVLRVGNSLAPSLSVEIIRVAAGQPAFNIWVGPRGVESVGIADLVVPTQPDGSIWVHYTRHDASRFVSAADVLSGVVDSALFREHLVLVGVTGLAITDYVATPLEEHLPGVEIHANVLENIFDGRVLRRPHWAAWLEALALLAAGALLIAAMPALRRRWWLAVLAVLVAALLGGGFAAYRFGRLLLDAATPVLGLGLVFTVMMAALLAEAEAQRRTLRQRLQRERENAARIAGELEAARRIQMSILPRASVAFPLETRFAIYAYLEPAREVGGDLYDFFMLDADHLFFLIGDVSGKGLSASMFMGVSKALCKSVSKRHPDSLAAFMCEADREIRDENPEMFFVTLLAGVLDVNTGNLWLCNAGHDTPYLIRRAGGQVVRIAEVGGPPLCTVDDYSYVAVAYVLQSGDTLCMVTDGVTEAMDKRGELFGNRRLAELINRLAREPAAADSERIGTAIREDVAQFCGAAEAADDVTILAITWTGPVSQPVT